MHILQFAADASVSAQGDKIMLDLLLVHWLGTTVVAAVVLSALFIVYLNTWVIAANESGLVIKRFGPPLASGRIIAMKGEAGYQARMLSPGWHFGLWRWRYSVVKVPTTVVRPGDIALVVAADGAAIPSERVLARSVACDNFQDAEAFLTHGGERGRQLAFLTAGTYRINPALFDVVTAANATKSGVAVEIAVSGDGSSGMANVMLAKLVAAAGEQKA